VRIACPQLQVDERHELASRRSEFVRELWKVVVTEWTVLEVKIKRTLELTLPGSRGSGL
jgi:hypothetical protein